MESYTYALKLAFRYIGRYPSYWFWFVLRIVYVIMGVAIPLMLGKIIDLLTSGAFNQDLYVWVGGYVVLLLISPMLEVLTALKVLYISSKIARDFKNDAIGLLENASIDFFKDKNRGAILKIIDSAHASLYRITEDIAHRYVTSIGSVIGIFLSAVIFKPFIIIVFFISCTLSLINLIVFGRREKKVNIEMSKHDEALTGRLAEFLANFRTVFYLNLFKKQGEDLRDKIEATYQEKLNVIRTSIRKWYNHGQLQQITNIAIFIFCVINVVQGNLTIGMLVVILAFSDRLSGQMGVLLDYSESFTERASALQRYHDELDKPLHCSVVAKTGLLKKYFERLEVSGLALVRDTRESLCGVDIDIKRGEKVAIIGHTGGGKSSLLDVVLKAAGDYQGTVALNGIDYSRLNGRDIVDIFSIVPQEVQLFRGTIRGNIASSRKIPNNADMGRLVAICALDHFVQRLPNGFDEPITEGATNISGGERQRIGIARALFQQHPFLILDEATASLDPKTEQEVVGNIIKEYPELTLLYITHKYTLLDQFDSILVMNEGKIIERGSLAQLKKTGSLFKNLYEAGIRHSS